MARSRIGQEIEQVVQAYTEHLEQELSLRHVYIYGSYVNGDATEDSDIDVAVVADDFTGDVIEDTMRLMRIRRKVDVRIEPHPFQIEEFQSDHPFVKEIIENGYEVFSQPVY
ncbi:nucleotidyltransferase domain-containing protein [Natribacillus halophilus]|uniref:Nucleotidyltransferase domain-containing protein n=1 Tax=Natribacillus halophilus TaxID=549003 RepID=A0A1G8M723_9BACI|nr:nucleotidyltransferase domain-containing protein [Natribacillus halophilus]SDI63756.1 Nucleotidyltransferase domain-containing protein [Natribacillus halophilus]